MPDDDFDPVAEGFRLYDQRPRKFTAADIEREMKRCARDIVYFINTYCFIYDNYTSSWVKFTLWPAQIDLLKSVLAHKYSLNPKARQLGISWLLGDVLPLWLMLFRPVAEILLFSQRDDEAMKLLERIKGTEGSDSTYSKLPDWMKQEVVVDNNHEFKLKNGSRIQALPSTAGGRSNTVTYVVIDEADFIPNLKSLITAAKPTIDAGDNRMVVLSTINEENPNSYFQRLCKANENSDAGWNLMFLGWDAHPKRNKEWYEDKRTATLVDNGTLDPLYKEYPVTLAEALAPRELNKRFPPDWIVALSAVRKPVPMVGLSDLYPIAGLKVYKVPDPARRYGIGVDPGGGKTDPSVAQVIDSETKEQIAVLVGLVEPTQFANEVHELSRYYNGAPVLFELNNHGHAFLSQAKERGTTLKTADITRRGQKARDPGWLSTERSKHMLFDVGAKIMGDAIAFANMQESIPDPIFCDSTTVAELASIERTDLQAPEGMHDDHVIAWLLAQMCVYRGTPSMQQTKHTGLYRHDRGEPQPSRKSYMPPMPMPTGKPAEHQPEPTDAPRTPDGVPLHILERFGRYKPR